MLHRIIEIIDPPENHKQQPFLGYLIDTWFEKDKGVVMLMEIKQGKVKRGDSIISCAYKKKFDIFEVWVSIRWESWILSLNQRRK